MYAVAMAVALMVCTAAWAAAPAADVLKGRWVRQDGGYMIVINGVGADGKLEAAYANPRPTPFSMAQARRDGDKLKVFLELRAGGYGGSTYTLAYDPASDSLRGVYHQAVAGQTYVVEFRRAR
jgi:hypothetical protein